jgi:uncharacterized protein RhaS with RHS repeats
MSYEYDNANNLTAIINTLPKRFEFEYDNHNNLNMAIDGAEMIGAASSFLTSHAK